jgi:hypothetical protein
MKILINGDSWGVGEWGLNLAENLVKDPKLPALTHRGLEHYFKEKGHEVVNISKGGGSNFGSLKNFNNLENKDYDFIFWFQTDFLRDDRHFTKAFPKKSVKWVGFTWDLINNHKRHYYREFYSKLNSYNKTIYLMGGANKINLEIISGYKNLVPIIPCISEFLLPDINFDNDLQFEGWIQGAWMSPFGKEEFVSNNLSIEVLEKVVEMKELNLREFTPGFTELFWPDGKHPNRLGHKIIFDYLCKELKI